MIDAAARPSLPDVTLVAVTSVAIGPTMDALNASMEQVEFGQVLLLSDRPPNRSGEAAIAWRRIDRLASRADYSRFMLRNLCEHISTSHALCVQWDGFVLNGGAWSPRFLDYDYIGAVWPQFHDGYNVGNGGFSLRSRRLLEACAELPLAGETAEDVVICRLARSQLERQGIRYAPEGVAAQFAYERTRQTGFEFGFHGAFNLVRYLRVEDAVRLFRSLDRRLLTASECWELIRWALGRGEWRLAISMLARLR